MWIRVGGTVSGGGGGVCAVGSQPLPSGMTWAPRVTFGTLVSWFVNVFLHFTLHCLLVCESK